MAHSFGAWHLVPLHKSTVDYTAIDCTATRMRTMQLPRLLPLLRREAGDGHLLWCNMRPCAGSVGDSRITCCQDAAEKRHSDTLPVCSARNMLATACEGAASFHITLQPSALVHAAAPHLGGAL